MDKTIEKAISVCEELNDLNREVNGGSGFYVTTDGYTTSIVYGEDTVWDTEGDYLADTDIEHPGEPSVNHCLAVLRTYFRLLSNLLFRGAMTGG